MIAAMWSGGKDSCMAVWKVLNSGIEVSKLICMLYEGKSRSHGFNADIVRRQSKAVGIDIVFGDGNSYGASLRNLIESLGIEKIVFGDIFLEEHRVWIEDFCSSAGVEPIFPLWGASTAKLAREFVDAGFEAYVVAARSEYAWLLGRRFDSQLIDELIDAEIDPCGENGEFHTLVVDGPIFRSRVEFSFSARRENEKYVVLEVV